MKQINISMPDAVPDAAPARPAVPDARPIRPIRSAVPNARPIRRKRDSNRLCAQLMFIFMGAGWPIIITTSVWWGSYKPLEHQLHNMEVLGALNCSLAAIVQRSPYHCGSRPGAMFITTWQIHGLDGRIRNGPVAAEYCQNVIDTSLIIPGLTRTWSAIHTCYFDPEEDNYVSMDLADIRASLATTGARYVTVMFFLAIIIILTVCAIVVIIDYNCYCR